VHKVPTPKDGLLFAQSPRMPDVSPPGKPVPMPVTQLVSKPAVTVLNGQLVAVRLLIDRRAA
jgi:hypothetical protein